MGRRNQSQGQLFYEFRLDEAVPDDHLVRKISALLDLSWVYAELAPYYSEIGRPSIDPVLMIRMLIIGYVFANRARATRGAASNHAPGGLSRRVHQKPTACGPAPGRGR